jgi:hypothetical protein
VFLGHSPIQVHEPAARQGHELVLPATPHMTFDGASNGFGPAGAWLDAHQIIEQGVIDNDGGSHTVLKF